MSGFYKLEEAGKLSLRLKSAKVADPDISPEEMVEIVKKYDETYKNSEWINGLDALQSIQPHSWKNLLNKEKFNRTGGNCFG